MGWHRFGFSFFERVQFGAAEQDFLKTADYTDNCRLEECSVRGGWVRREQPLSPSIPLSSIDQYEIKYKGQD